MNERMNLHGFFLIHKNEMTQQILDYTHTKKISHSNETHDIDVATRKHCVFFSL